MTVKTEVIQSINPADESLIEEVPITEPKRVKEIIGKASVAQVDWSMRPLEDRIELLRETADTLDERSDELAEDLTTEQGKPLSESLGELNNAVKRINYFCDRAPDCFGDRTVEVDESTTGRIKQKPHGVVAAIKPWNFPVNLPLWTIVPALLAGNSVIFKPSELTPVIGRKLIECFPDELSSGNVLNLVQGGGEVGRTIVSNELVDFVSFIGSRETGEWIYRNSSPHLRNISLELGGKDPLLVLDDADPDRALDGLVHGAFKNCGQVCCGIERCLVHEDLYDDVFEGLKERIEQLTVGNGMEEATDIGPMIRKTEKKRVKKHLRDAEDKGAMTFQNSALPDPEQGFWQAPSVVTNVSRDMKIMNDETFGPALALMSFRDEEDAIEEANRLEYGLGASVYSEDTDHAARVADRLRAGSIGINQIVGSIVELPWGGVKKSGVGRLLNEEGMTEFSESVVERWNPEEFERIDSDGDD
jgi:acyl-CoA reductase-like NAD-dependent aldehyde dehydrogenase